MVTFNRWMASTGNFMWLATFYESEPLGVMKEKKLVEIDLQLLACEAVSTACNSVRFDEVQSSNEFTRV